MIDFQCLSEYSGLKKPEHIVKMLLQFRSDIVPILAAVRKSLTDRDRERIQSAAHGAKGLGFAIQAKPFADEMKMILESAPEADWDELETKANEIFGVYITILDQIDNYIETHNLFSSIDLSAYTIAVSDDNPVSQLVLCKKLQHFNNPKLEKVKIKTLEIPVEGDTVDMVLIQMKAENKHVLNAVNSIRSGKTSLSLNTPLIITCLGEPSHDYLKQLESVTQAVIQEPVTIAKLSRELLRVIEWRESGGHYFFEK